MARNIRIAQLHGERDGLNDAIPDGALKFFQVQVQPLRGSIPLCQHLPFNTRLRRVVSFRNPDRFRNEITGAAADDLFIDKNLDVARHDHDIRVMPFIDNLKSTSGRSFPIC